MSSTPISAHMLGGKTPGFGTFSAGAFPVGGGGNHFVKSKSPEAPPPPPPTPTQVLRGLGLGRGLLVGYRTPGHWTVQCPLSGPPKGARSLSRLPKWD